MKLYKHQEEISIEVQSMVNKFGMSILCLPERSGKTLTVIDAIKNLGFKHPLWITKKNAIESIKIDAKNYNYNILNIINYEMLHKNIINPDVIILDEFHTVSSYPKPSVRLKNLKQFKGIPIIYISASPATESASQWFMPLSLSSTHEFGLYKNFYEWASVYVNIQKKRIGNFYVNDYSNAKDEMVMNKVSPFIIKKTREELGFKFEPNIIKHKVVLSADTKNILKKVKRERMINDIPLDTPTKLISALYQIECGTIKDDKKYIEIGNTEIIDYIKDKWGDSNNIAIMSHWIGQREQISKSFNNALILSSTSHAEGIELSHIDTLVIASMDYSTARFQQRNARQASKKRDKPINVNIIVTDGYVSEKVFESVAVKHENFNARMMIKML